MELWVAPPRPRPRVLPQPRLVMVSVSVVVGVVVLLRLRPLRKLVVLVRRALVVVEVGPRCRGSLLVLVAPVNPVMSLSGRWWAHDAPGPVFLRNTL